MKDIRDIIADNVRLYSEKRKFNTDRACGTSRTAFGFHKTDWEWKKNYVTREFLRLSDAPHVPLSFFLYIQMNKIPEAERIYCSRSNNQKEYLLHMLQEMAEGMYKLL